MFTPSRPQSADHLFVGRRPTIERIIRAIQEEHAHVVVYGGRGIGKTSVGNVVADSARRAGYHIARCTCDSETSFERLFQEFLKNLPHDLMDRSAPANGLSIRTVDELLDVGRLAPTDLSNIFHDLIEPIIFIVDEFDRVRDATFRRKMSEAIKVISDSTDLLTVVIMGVGQTLHELFGHHLSIQRHIRAIRLPLMENHEIRKLLRQGEARANITFDEAVLESVTALSRGTPYYAHLLGLLSGRHALARESTAVGPKDLSAAIVDLLVEIDPNVVAGYERTTQEESNLFMTDVLYAAAAAPFDAYGSFSVSDVCEELASCTGKPYQTLVVACALSRLSKDGGILEKWTTAGGAIMYEFVNPLMRQYILLRQFERRGGTTPYTFPDIAPPPDGDGKAEPLQRHRSWS